MAKSVNYWTRKFHRWGAILCCVPLLLVVASGLLLQLKKQIAWIQPVTQSTGNTDMRITWEDILETTAAVPQARVESWRDIDRLDVRPEKGIVKVQCRNRHELQLDLATGTVLSSTVRRSDFIESLHDGSYFGEYAKLAVFLPSALILLGLWASGMWLWYVPIATKARKRRQGRFSPPDKSLA